MIVNDTHYYAKTYKKTDGLGFLSGHPSRLTFFICTVETTLFLDAQMTRLI